MRELVGQILSRPPFVYLEFWLVISQNNGWHGPVFHGSDPETPGLMEPTGLLLPTWRSLSGSHQRPARGAHRQYQCSPG